jgi:glutamyl-tRNA synthetase
MSKVRVRIAPSPSGFLHIGTAKIALFNWLFARKEGGTFILRLEDTDAERSDETYAEAMCEGFRWLGIEWDEGPAFGGVPEKGAYGPYRQSQRKALHQKEAYRLLQEGKAYKCFCTKEELDAERARAIEEKRPPRYSGKCRNLTPEEIAEREGQPFALRFRVPEGETVLEDLVQGTVRVSNKEIDDFIILRPNGDPIFHLAVVVDDGTMKITHVIRGDDHLTNAFRHVLLFQALGYPLPKFAHLPMVLDEHGRKYSKREHGANVLDWRDDGYLPEALINYVALLGWTPEEEGRELFTLPELVEAFTIERWGKSPARFDRKKLDWLNGQHIRRLSPEDLCQRILPFLHKAGFDTSKYSHEWLVRMTVICQEKISTLKEIVKYTDFFFMDVSEYEEKGVKKYWRSAQDAQRLDTIADRLRMLTSWSVDALRHAIETLASEQNEMLGAWVHPMRLALTGKTVGPGLFELAELLGKDTCIQRLERAASYVREMIATHSIASDTSSA